MESRRIILLTQGYLRGWLTFDYKTQLSRIREEYLLSSIERSMVGEMLSLRAISDSAISSGIGTPEAIRFARDTYVKCFDLTLPYLAKQSTLKSGEITKEEMAELRQILHNELKKDNQTKL